MTSEIPDFQVQEPPEKRPPCKKKDRNRMKLAVKLKDLTDSNYKKFTQEIFTKNVEMIW